MIEGMNNQAPRGLLHMRYAESVRVWQLVTLALVFIIAVLAVALASLFPLKETQYRYVEFLNSPDVYFRVMPSADLSVTQKELFLRKALRKYVYDRNVKDDVTERIRAQTIRAMSDDSVWNVFKEQFSSMITQMDGINREVEIISDNFLDKENGIHLVEFRTIDKKDSYFRVRNFNATVRYEANINNMVDKDDELLNPLGITIKSYNLSERKLKEEDK
jgi:type IV secretory pathway component VirB8